MKQIIFVIIFLSIITVSIYSDIDANEISKKNFNLKKADDDYSLVSIVIIDDKGNKKTRKIKMYSKEDESGKITFIEFTEPADLKNTRLLTISSKEGADDQRLYLPALNKVRKITSSNKEGKFMGSDLYYYDLETRYFEDCTYEYVKEDVYNKMECWVINSYPKDKDAPYSKMQSWISKENDFRYYFSPQPRGQGFRDEGYRKREYRYDR